VDEYTRPASVDDLKLLIKSLNEQGAEYFLIGGYALFAHGYHRATTDIDFLVPATRAAGETLKRALMVLPGKSAEEIDVAWFEEAAQAKGDEGAIRIADEYVVDIMFTACGQTYDMLRQHAATVYIEDIPVKTIDLEGLLLTKKTAREKDMVDRLVLERAIAACRKQG
jgi:predicted nucleotidyltransferase